MAYKDITEAATEINILQVNLARSYKANQSLCNFQRDEDSDISLIQEPYTLKNRIIGFPLKHRIVVAKQDPKTAIIVHKDNFTVFPVFIESDVIAIKLKKGNREFLLINCYCPPNGDINAQLTKIEEILQKHKCADIIITGDFSARNEMWGSYTTDQRGEKVLELIVSNNLNILNKKDSPPTFKTSRAKGWIDLTLVSTALAKDINRWEVLKVFNNSDHRYILTTIKNVKEEEKVRFNIKSRS